MTENKLTLEDCLKYSNASLINPLGLKTKSVIELINCCYNANITINKLIKIDNLKLILRHISQLTDEEEQYIVDKNFMHNIEVLFEYDINEIIRNTYSNKTIKLIDYFREIGIDIDGMFASGKAVKE